MFKIKWKQKAVKELASLPKSASKQIILKVDKLSENPIKNSFPLSGCDYRKIRAGNYRAIIEIVFSKKIIKILKIGHRKKIYKRFFKKK